MRTVLRPAARLIRREVDILLDLFRRRGRSAAVRASRLTGAAVAAYLVAHWLSPNSQPLLAPLTALLVVQVTLFSTLTSGVERVVSVVAGVLVAVAFSASNAGFTWWGLGILIAASIVVGQLLRLGPHLLEVPISAMLVLAVGGAESAAAGRITETLVGAGVGVVVNLVLPPPVETRSARVAVDRFVAEMAQLLGRIADEMFAGVSADQAARWLEDARRLTRHVARVDRAIMHAEESRRLNPRAVGTVDTGPALRSGLEALEHCSVAVRGLCRSLADLVAARGGDEAAPEQLREPFAVLLRELADAVSAFGELVLAEARMSGQPDEARLATALDAVREARARLTELLLVDPREDPGRWELHGALLAHVERALRELDVEERARQRERRRREAAARPLSAQAVRRLRTTTRQVADRPFRGRGSGSGRQRP